MDPNQSNDVPPQPGSDALGEMPRAADQDAPDTPPQDAAATPTPDAPPAEEAATAAPSPNAAPPPPKAAIRLGHVHGDLRIQAWAGEPEAMPHARLHSEDLWLDIQPEAYIDAAIDDDAILLVAGALDVAVNRVDGDLVAARLRGALDVATVQGDATLDGITGPVVLSEVHGDATAVNLGDDFTLLAAQGDLSIDRVSGTVRIDSVHGDANLRHAGRVDVMSVHGDLRVQEISALVVGRHVHGDVTLATVERAMLRHVKGDLTAVSVPGLLQATKVEGDARLRDMAGQVRLAEVEGDLSAQDLAGGIVAEAEGDAYLETRLVAGQTYQITAGSIVLRARSPISAQFVAQSEGGEIRTHLPLTVERHRQALAGVIGQGEATVTLISTNGDIILDAAGSESAGHEHGRHRDRSNFRVHVGHGPHGPAIDISGLNDLTDILSAFPFTGGFTMSEDNTPLDYSDVEERLRDLGERSSRAARKAAEKFRDYADRAARRARETDWDAVSRDVRTAIERTVGELENAFREIMAEFDAEGPTTGAAQPKAKGPTAQRIPIDHDPIDTTASPVDTPPPEDRAARRRAILEQVKNGTLTLEQADAQLRDL
jgi:DUF4097 and DUF4098 domain-containing protein YvlB